MPYQVTGVDASNGNPRSITLSASSPTDARAKALQAGIEAQSTQRISMRQYKRSLRGKDPNSVSIPIPIAILLALAIGLTGGYFAGREHLKHQLETEIRNLFSNISMPETPPGLPNSTQVHEEISEYLHVLDGPVVETCLVSMNPRLCITMTVQT